MTNDSSPERLPSIDSPIADLVGLFRSALAEVSFPEIDASILGAATERVAAQASEVERLLQALGEAREGLQAEQQSLRDLARKAHAYAQVYATDDSELQRQLSAIVFDRPRQRASKKTRTRRSKGKTPQLTLDSETPPQALSAG